MSTSELQFPLFCYIVVAGHSGLEGQRLTDEEGHVTIVPATAGPDIKQEWQITLGDDKNLIIRRPGDFVPTPYLTYDGVPKEPQQGNRVIVQNPPFNEWHVARVPEPGLYKGCLRVVGSDLGIAVAPIPIFPPLLQLSLENQVEWVFVPVPPRD